MRLELSGMVIVERQVVDAAAVRRYEAGTHR